MPMLEQNREPEVESSPYDAGSEQKQRRQMLIALALLLVALIAVFLKDREFWQQFLFPSTSTAATEPEPTDQTALDDSSQARPRTPGGQSVAVPSKAKAHPVPAAAIPEPTMAPVVTNRAVLPPLEVEVVAGDEHRTVQPGNPSVKVDLRPRTPPTYSGSAASGASGGDGGAVNATAQVHLSPGAAQVVSRPVDPTYPLLAKQMKVQGSVVLQALIGKDGNIQDLHVLSGPAILSAAAREAVKQWRFKPYMQAGQAVETEARITVNFTISTQ